MGARELLRKLLAENPGLTKAEARAAFLEMARSDPGLLNEIISEVADELGPEAAQALVDQRTRH